MIEYRKAEIEDKVNWINFCLEISDENLPFLFHKDKKTFRETLDASYENAIAASTILIAYNNKEMVGSLDIRKNSKIENRHVVSFGISVKKNYRNSGIGKMLIQKMEEILLHQNKIIKIELEVFSNNINAIELYKKMGYQIEGKKIKHINLNNELIDLIEMGKFLTTASS